MRAWKDLLCKVLQRGFKRPDRTGVGTLALFGEQLIFDNREEFPAVTTKKLAFAQMAAELACFLRGYDNLEQFRSMGCTIWDGNGSADYWLPKARREGDLGRIYGVQWRDWKSVLCHDQGLDLVKVDQLKDLVDRIRTDPYGRRHVVTAYNPGEVEQMCLPPCHVLFQAFVTPSNELWLRVDMRSVDLFLGLPFDVASYALLQRLLAKELGLSSGFLCFQMGDCHIYLNHEEQVRLVLQREVCPPPRLWLDPNASLFDFHPLQAHLLDYNHHGAVAAPLNV